MGFLDTVKSWFGGAVEGKLGELFTNIINTVKPLVENGKVSEAVKSAIENYGDLGDKLKDVLAKLSTAGADAKTGLISEKNDVVAAIKEKGGALLETLEKEGSAIPAELKSLVAKGKELLQKL